MQNFFKKKNTILYPWGGKESIYNYIKRNINSEGILAPGHDELPDSAEYFQDKSFRWVSGAMDGVMGHHTGIGDNNERVLKALKLLRKQVKKPSNATRRDTYLEFMEDDLLGYIDSLLDLLRKQPDLNYQALYDEAKWFAKEGAHRGVVKIGIALLGIFDCEKDEELLLTLGKHEEFTLYVAVAIMNGFSNSNQKIFEMAKCVRGWGKIHLVERLEANSDEIRDWLLKYGCDNNIMPGYLAYTCAVKGDLKHALESQSIDKELYNGAGLIISALIEGGPAENIDDYDDAMPVIADFIRHSKTHCKTLSDFWVISCISNFLAEDGEVWNNRLEAGWDIKVKENCLDECKKIIRQEKWEKLVWDDLGSEDNYLKFNAAQVARILGIDIWEHMYAELQAKPLDGRLYYELMRTDNRERIIKLLKFAEENLPLKDIASGYGNEMGLGSDYMAHGCLDFILQDLGRYEGVGGKLILTGIQSPVTRNRNMALRVLEEWNKSSWPGGITEILNELYMLEENPNVKEKIETLLKKLDK